MSVVAPVTEWELFYGVRPWTSNSERTWHHYKRASMVKEWREAFWALAKEAKIPPLTRIGVVVTPVLNGRGRIQDVGGCFPAAKAAIDGLVDANVIPEDGPMYVRWLLFKAPERGLPGLRLVVCEAQ